MAIDKTFAEKFSKEWIESWNSHDMNRILAHYSDDFEMSSPVIIKLMGNSDGTIRGKPNVGDYWRKALDLHPGLHFELIAVFTGVSSITIHYKGHRGYSMEVLHFNDDRIVFKAYAHYEELI